MKSRISLPGLLAAILMFTVTVGMHEAAIAKPYSCDKRACWCSGSKNCDKMMSGENCKTFRCNNDHGTTVCWCEL
jgi:hypothetical protein